MLGSKRIWIVGGAGSLGSEIRKIIDSKNYRVLVTDMDVDITDMDTVTSYCDINRPEVVINCAGMTDLKACEADMVKAFHVNALGARNLAIASRKVGAKIIHISTDDVFDGVDGMELTEFDENHPLSVYGKSKKAGENFVRELNPKHIIVRSSWVYGVHGHNYLSKLLAAVKESKKIQVPNDQISTPTSAEELAKFILTLFKTNEYGTFHASCEGSCTRYEFAKTILEYTGIKDVEVEAVLSDRSSVLNAAKCTVLRNLMMEITGIYKMPAWRDALKSYLKDHDMLKINE